jgi:hypothetical protein
VRDLFRLIGWAVVDLFRSRAALKAEICGIMAQTATEPLTAREIAERVLAAANIKRPDKAALADLIGTVLASLRNHQGKGVQRVNEGSPAKWRLAS